MTFIVDNPKYSAEYFSGFLWIVNKEANTETMTRLTNLRGQCVTRGQFKDSIRTHGENKSCEVFEKLGITTHLKPKNKS